MDAIADGMRIDLPEPVVVLSDLHLGHPGTFLSDPSMIAPLLEGTKTVLFNGDTYELYNPRYRSLATDQLERLFELCHTVGTAPWLLPGNHDPWASNWLSVDLADGQVFVTHGDVIHWAMAPWARDAAAFRREYQRLTEHQGEPTTLEGTLQLNKQLAMIAGYEDHGSRSGWRGEVKMLEKFAGKPLRVLYAINYWRKVESLARQFLARFRPNARMMIFGHTHRPGNWFQHDVKLVNTGSYQTLSYPQAVYLDKERASVHRAIWRKGAYHPGPIRFELSFVANKNNPAT